MRLDIYLVTIKLAKTRNQAQEMIRANLVSVNDKIITKANFNVTDADKIIIIESWKYVSRAGYKLAAAITNFKIDFTNKIVLDIGASTGGFVDCALEHHAKQVFALDVGTSQLAEKLLNDHRVVNLANTNLKQIPELNLPVFEIITCDVSFISLKHVFESIKSVCNKNTILIFLIKPQFELGPQLHNGYVKNEKLRQQAINNVIKAANQNNFALMSYFPSPITGAKAENIEYLAWFKKQ